MDFDFDETVAAGLRRYVNLVTGALGLTGECSYVEVERPAGAYLALDGGLARFPDRDLALLWNEEHGWSMAVETDSAEDPLVLAHMGGDPLPSPGEVAEWTSNFLRVGHDTRPAPATPVGDTVGDPTRRLRSYAAVELVSARSV
ncbi:DUF6292 family protein [Umezawaea sp. Da 62-37]|uniref:DUF6292 family protein n=1 Tax=Umezawaea sp. Da 62-37 TaxID=3075927 RepID=UPI0028F6EC40|nr:DUF6292 family protein [Umezawaea sp. Da 62-37]WNV87830.1 DUF6292 family protein [Umezawaea sp. Da 62-37]